MHDSAQQFDLSSSHLALLSLASDLPTPHLVDPQPPPPSQHSIASSTLSSSSTTPSSAEPPAPYPHLPTSATPILTNHHPSNLASRHSYFTSDSVQQPHIPSPPYAALFDEEFSRMSFVVGTTPSHIPTASWPAPAVDNAYMHPPSFVPASLRPPLQYPPVSHPVTRPLRKDPWAQAAVWRPAPHTPSLPLSDPLPSNGQRSFVSSPLAPFSHPHRLHFNNESKPQRRRKRTEMVQHLPADLSSSSAVNCPRVSADSSATADVSLSTTAPLTQGGSKRSNSASSAHANHQRGQAQSHAGGRNINGNGTFPRDAQGGPNGHLSVREYNRRISAYARRRDLNGALRTLGDLDRAPKVSRNLFTYNAVINALVMCSQHAKADDFWHEMQESGIEPNLVTFNTMLKSCFGGMDEDVQRAFRLLQDMEKRGICADRVTLNSLINACVSAGRVRDAQGVYEEMRRLNIEPDAYTFCTLAKQARHQCDVSMLDSLLLHQLHHHTVLQEQEVSVTNRDDGDPAAQLSPVAYNTIADAYIRCGYPTRAIRLLERMRDVKHRSGTGFVSEESVIPVRPDVQTFNVRLKALRECGVPASEAFAVLEEMRSLNLEADHITLLTLADLCCRRGEMSLAEGVLHAATEADIKEFEKGSMEWRNHCHVSKDGKQGLSSGRGGSGHVGQRHTASQRSYASSGAGHLPQHHSSGRRNSNQPRNAKANAALFNALIRGYSSLEPPNVDAAVALYMEMRRFVEKHGFMWYAADSVTYTMLVDGFARVGDAGRAEVIISEMEAAGRSNVVAYNAYLKANRGNGYKAALSVLERMRNVGLRPDVVTYNTVIDFLSAEENGTQIAEELVRVDMPRNGIRPDLLTFNTLIKGVARNRGSRADAGAALGAAYRWLRELQSKGLKPDEFTYQSMVSACAAAGDAPRALEFFRKVEAERAKRVKVSGVGNGFSASSTRFGMQGIPRHQPTPNPLSSASSGTSLADLPRTSMDAWGPVNRNSDSKSFTSQPNQNSADWMLLPHPAAYVALMRAFLSSSAKDGVDSVLLLRDEMVARGLELGRTGYTAVADAYAERGDFDSVEVTLHDMVMQEGMQGQKLSAVHHCIRMKALVNAGRLDDAIGVLPEVENADSAVFNVLIFACAKNKDMDRMTTVLRAMERSEVEPDAITNRALSGMMRNVARTLKTFDERFRSNITAFVSEQQDHSDA